MIVNSFDLPFLQNLFLPAKTEISKFVRRTARQAQSLNLCCTVPTKITYYPIVDRFQHQARTRSVLRRTIDNEGRDDKAFTTYLRWEHSGSLYSYERGNADAKFYEITEDEANQIVACIRRIATGEQ